MKSIHKPAYRVFVECLIDLRHSAGLTQVELAEAINEDQSFISKYEGAQRRLDLIELRRICDVLGYSLPKFVNHFEDELARRGLE